MKVLNIILLIILFVNSVLCAGMDCGNSGATHSLEYDLDAMVSNFGNPCQDALACLINCSGSSSCSANVVKVQLPSVTSSSSFQVKALNIAYDYACIKRKFSNDPIWNFIANNQVINGYTLTDFQNAYNQGTTLGFDSTLFNLDILLVLNLLAYYKK